MRNQEKIDNLKTQSVAVNNYFKLPNPGLRAYFEHVVQGQPDEYRTPFYKGKSLTTILKMWDEELRAIEERWPTLYQYEKDLAAKVGPMSIMKPLSERLDDIDSYYSAVKAESKPIDSRAVDAVWNEWKRGGGLRVRSRSRTNELMKKSTNSGAPFFTKRKNVQKDTLPFEIVYSEPVDSPLPVVSQSLSNGKTYRICAVLGWRGQEGGPKKTDTKQRVVWMFPYAVNVAELQVYQPLIEMCQSNGFVPAWISMDEVDKCITKMFDTKADDDLVICTDFSKFDQHFNPDMQSAAATLIGKFFSDPYIKGWLRIVFPIKYNIPLMLNYGEIVSGPHGMGSGSGGTNADETLAHRALQHEAAILHGSKLNPFSQCLGDDGVITYPGCTVEDVVQTYSSHGQEMNPDKQYASKHDCTYLRRWHHKDYRVDGVCVGVYSTMRALGRLAEQERYYDPEVWGPKMVALRQLSILENVKWHPLREQFVDFCMKGDKYRLGLDIPGFFDKLDSIASEAIDYMPDFLGYTKSLQNEVGNKSHGINDWWIVNYLKSKR